MPARKLNTSPKAATKPTVAKPTGKPANTAPKAATKPTNAKPATAPASKPVAAEKPDAAKTEAAQAALTARREAHAIAQAAVHAFYPGASLPFKATADTFRPINENNVKQPSQRTAGLLLALLTYGRGNINPDGTFIRGGFNVPADAILGAKLAAERGFKPGDTIKAQPESGCIGNMLGRAVHYVSGPRDGKAQNQAVYRLDFDAVRREIAPYFGDKHNALIASYTKP